MSPYIVTTKRPQGAPGVVLAAESRRAVATLEKAQGTVDVAVQDVVGWNTDAGHVIGPSGGTVGPLPDGTVIEVEAVTIGWLTERAGLVQGLGLSARFVCDAYNARQS